MKYMQTQVTEGTPEMSKRMYPCYVVVCLDAKLERKDYSTDSFSVIGTVYGDLEAALDCILAYLDDRAAQEMKEALPLSVILLLRSKMRKKFGPGIVCFDIPDYPEWTGYGYEMSFEIHPVYLPGALIQRILDSDEPAEHTTNNDP